jgi:hypothetical protein
MAQQQAAQGRQLLDIYQGGLGIGSDEAFNAGLERFKQSSGYQNILNSAMRGVTASGAARGLLNSGAALREYQNRSVDLADRTYQNYLAQILGGSQTATGNAQGFGGLIGSAGQVGPTQGIAGAIGQGVGAAASAGAFSDRRLKTNIQRVGTRKDGLGLYEYTLKTTGERQIGVMADEVAQLRPEALGPVVEGYATVRYDLL